MLLLYLTQHCFTLNVQPVETCAPKPDCDNAVVERSHIDETLNGSEGDPERYRRPLKFWRPMERLNSEKCSREFIFRAPTRSLYELWRRAQRW